MPKMTNGARQIADMAADLAVEPPDVILFILDHCFRAAQDMRVIEPFVQPHEHDGVAPAADPSLEKTDVLQ